MNPYDRYLLPRLTHWACSSPVIERQRALVVPRARGCVLEIGFGSGLNLPYYDRARVERIWALEPAASMRTLAAPRIAASGMDVTLLDAKAEEASLPDACIDSAVATFCLCTIPDPRAALGHVRRMLKPDGRLYFLEHGAAPDAGTRRWQDRLNGVWGCLAGGCNLNRAVVALIEDAGFAVEDVERAYLRHTPRVVGYVSWGAARPA
jgi:SAM-dependent methyltransferase